jgi:carbonic anhydrase
MLVIPCFVIFPFLRAMHLPGGLGYTFSFRPAAELHTGQLCIGLVFLGLLNHLYANPRRGSKTETCPLWAIREPGSFPPPNPFSRRAHLCLTILPDAELSKEREKPMRLTAIAVLLLAPAALLAAQNGANWSYQGKTGPIVWGKLDPAYQACSKGHEQSPLEIRNTRLDKSLQPLEFHYVAGPMTLVNTGRGIVARVDPGSTMVANGVRYQLIEIQFHHPSEHSIKGKFADIEVELVHRSDDGKTAIVAVLLNQDRGFPNALLASLWPHLPTQPNTSAKVADLVSAGGFLPADRGYWTYLGSELEPPCTEGVRWFVFEQDLSISRQQFRAFSNLYKMNTRPVQDAHGRKIEASE